MLCVIGRSEIGETRLLVARMQQELGLAAFWPEHAIAGDNSVANEMSVEVLAHRRGKRVELLGPLRRALRLTKDLGVAAKLLVEAERPSRRSSSSRASSGRPAASESFQSPLP